jgi:hypothetical protein
MLRKPEVLRKYAAIHLLSNLVRVDTEKRFEQIFNEFYQLLSHESPKTRKKAKEFIEKWNTGN